MFLLEVQQFELPSFHSAWHHNRNAISLKKSLSSWFSAVWPFQVLKVMFMHTYASSRVKRKIAFIEKVNSGCFCWFPVAILVRQSSTPIWRLHTKLYKVAWNILANNSETVGHKDLRLGQIVYIHALVFYNISFSWLLPLDGSQFIYFFCKLRSLNWFQTFNTFFFYFF